MADDRTNGGGRAAPSAAPTAAAKHHDPLGPLGDFVPWILYWVIVGQMGFRATLAIAAGAALVLLLARKAMGQPMRTLNVGSVVVFLVLLGLAFVVDDAFLERWLQPLSNLGLLLVVLGGMAIGRPFVLDYSRDSVSPEMAATPGFLWLNQRFTAIWAVAFAVMTISAFVPPLVEGEATIREGGSTLSIIGYWVVPYLAFGGAALANMVLVKGIQGPDADAGALEEDRSGTGLRAGAEPDGDSADLRVTVPGASMVDEAFPVRVEGLSAGDRVDLEVQLVDALNRRFVSRATFTASEGAVDTADDAPTAGSWTGADPTAAFWSASWDEDGPAQLFLPSWGPMHGSVEVRTGERRSTTAFVRHGLARGVEVADVREPGVVGRLFLPSEPASAGVVLVGGSEGGIDSMSASAGLLASCGIAAMVVGIFGAEGLPSAIDVAPLEPIGAGAAALAARSGLAPEAVALLGISRGSEAVLSAAAHLPGLRCSAVIGLSPGSVVWESMAEDGSPTGRSSWTVGGEQLPFVGVDSVAVDRDLYRTALHHLRDRHSPRLMHLRAAYEGGLESPDADAAAIPVEQIDAPLHLFVGEADALWPSGPMARRIVERRAVHRRTDDRTVTFPGAGHLLRLPVIPVSPFTTGGIDLGGEPAGHAAAQAALGRALLDILAPDRAPLTR
jgi:hypothetical protein